MTSLSHVEFYVGDAMSQAADFKKRYGFEVVAVSNVMDDDADHFSVVLRQNAIVLVLTEARNSAHPAATFVESHGDGVADIALRVKDAGAAFKDAVRRGAEAVDAGSKAIRAFGDVRHSFVDGADLRLPRLPRIELTGGPAGTGMLAMDHFAVCLPSGQLTAAVAFYEAVLDMREIFKERIQVGSQAMRSSAVQSVDRTVTLTLIEPDPDADAGQIDEFLKNHDGAGVQHIAFSCADVVAAVSALGERGVDFLQTPGSYYDHLAVRLSHVTDTDRLRALNILVDQDQEGQLFQIFTSTTHPRRTLFFEIIERIGARTFGSNNIRALYEAKEAEHIKGQVSS
jgi:4-hydroxymandelate synthase